MDGRGVIFVGGSMRAGTTLLQRMLCASESASSLRDECQYLTSLMDLHDSWLMRSDWLRDYFGGNERYNLFAKSIVDGLLRNTFETQSPARSIVLKHPELTMHFPTLAEWYPAAKFVVIVRDPRDTIASTLDVADRHRESGVTSGIANYGRDMARLSAAFKAYYVDALQSPKCKDRIAVVRYEDIVSMPEQALASLSQYLGIALRTDLIPTDPVSRRERDAYGAAFWTNLRAKPPSRDSIGRYRTTLSPEEIAAIEQHCADFNRIFRYW